MESADDAQSYSIFRILKTKTKRHSTFIERFWARQRQSLSLYSRLNPSYKNSRNTRLNQNSNSETTLPSDIQLYCLDANTLLTCHNNKNRHRPESIDDASSLANSSLDLEWEHEKHNTSWLILQEDFSSGSDDNGSTSEISRRTSNTRLNFRPLLNPVSGHASLSSSRQSSRYDMLPNRGKYSRRSKSNNSWSHISTPDSLEWDLHEDDQKFKSEDDLLDHETLDLLNEIEWLKNRALHETGEHTHSDSREQES